MNLPDFYRNQKTAKGSFFCLLWSLFFLLATLFTPTPGSASEIQRVLEAYPINTIFPGADHVGTVSEPPASLPVFSDNKLIGYAFLTSDIVKSAGYSGKPVKILAGIDLDGKITGVVVAEHHEPILVLGIPDTHLQTFVDQLKGADIRQRIRLDKTDSDAETGIDMISGATITSLVFSDSVMRAARLVGLDRGIISADTLGRGRALDLETYREADWPALVEEGSLRQLILSNREVDAAFNNASSDTTSPTDGDKTFIELYGGLMTPASIGQNLLGFVEYNKMMTDLPEGAEVIFVAARGFYSFRGYNYRRSGTFERLQLIQGDKSIQLKKEMHQPIKSLAIANAPELREVSLFVLPAEVGFDPTEPWRLEVLVERDIPEQGNKFASFPFNYALPTIHFLPSETAPEVLGHADNPDMPLWERRWYDNSIHVVTLCLALTMLLALLIFSDWAVKHYRAITWFRVGFLSFTFLYIGLCTTAQLSVINVLTFINSLLTEFRWDFFLLEPLIFILWGFVALALLFWGRGVFCGWACPFGALQELINRLAVFVRLPQFTLPFTVNERLWPIKYVLFLGLLALSLGPAEMAGKMVEIEPFKTAISLKFVRSWPFVVYALGLLVAAAFVNRVFCRYICPLGAALAIPANNRMFDWLKRHKQCGTECQVCAIRCPVQAIHPDGHIDLHECIYCLDCQAIYHDDHLCPPMVEQRKRRERRLSMSSGTPADSPAS